MNNIKKMILGFAAVAMIVSFSAFKNSKGNNRLNTYYPVETTTGHFSWQIVNTANYDCVPGAAACSSYEAETAPNPDVIPAGYEEDGFVLRLKD